MEETTDFTTSALITLKDGTMLQLGAEDFAVSYNGFTDSADMLAFPVGAAICRTCQLELANYEDQYEDVSFLGAVIRLSLDFAEANDSIAIGKYTVTEPETYGETVIITAQDDMYKADKPFSTALTFPATANALFAEICATCGIDTQLQTIPNGTYEIAAAPDTEYTYRSILGYLAMLSGGNARISRGGYLEIINYDFDSLNSAREENGGPLVVAVNITPSQSGSGDPSPTNVRRITGWAGTNVYLSGEDTSEYSTLPVDFQRWVYKGSINVSTGVLTEEYKCVTLTGSDVTSQGTASTGAKYISCDITDTAVEYDTTGLSDQYTFTSSPPSAGETKLRMRTTRIVIYDDRFTSKAAAQTLLNASPVQVMFKLASENAYQLASQAINALVGENNIWSDAGAVSVETVDGDTYTGDSVSFTVGAYVPENMHDLDEWSRLRIDLDDIVITGVQTHDTEGDVVLVGNEGYVLSIENPLITGNEQTGLTLIGGYLIGGRFRSFEGEHTAYPLAEFGDLCRVTDRKGKRYYTVLTDIDFQWASYTAFGNSAESPLRNASQYVSPEITAIQASVKQERTAREQAISDLNAALANAGGMYSTVETLADQSKVYYLHDKPTLASSLNVIKITSEALGFSTDGGQTYPTGVYVNGTVIASILNTIGINADWINSGALTISDSNDVVIFTADATNGTVEFSNGMIKVQGSGIRCGDTSTIQIYTTLSQGGLDVGRVGASVFPLGRISCGSWYAPDDILHISALMDGGAVQIDYNYGESPSPVAYKADFLNADPINKFYNGIAIDGATSNLSDLDDATAGMVQIIALDTSTLNTPLANAAGFVVSCIDSSGNEGVQQAWIAGSATKYIRYLTSGTWTAWAVDSVTVDSAISGSSTNPVENQAVYAALAAKQDKLVKLWENSSPTSAFAAQTILDDGTIADYDLFAIKFKEQSTSTGSSEFIFWYSKTSGSNSTTARWVSISGGNVFFNSRSLSISDGGGITFTAGARYTQGSSSAASNNAYMVPLEIYGMKL